jgi:O-6-methylguanine DNA methyltransferase
VTPAFTARVLSVVRSLPAGRVATYGDVAALAGQPGAARAVGNIMRGCRDVSVPCHRVVAAGGHLGGYGGRETLKATLLSAEGVRVVRNRIREFARVRWECPATASPRHANTSPRRSVSLPEPVTRPASGHARRATPRPRGPV